MLEWLMQPTTLIAAVPIVLLLALITFEVGMALTIGSLPRNKSIELTPEHWRKMRRAWLMLGLAWPVLIGGALVLIFAPQEARFATVGLIVVGIGWGLWTAHRRGRWRKHAAEGRCAGCGYDLRGTIGHRTDCPECGRPVTPPGVPRSRGGERHRDAVDVARTHRHDQVAGLSDAAKRGEQGVGV